MAQILHSSKANIQRFEQVRLQIDNKNFETIFAQKKQRTIGKMDAFNLNIINF